MQRKSVGFIESSKTIQEKNSLAGFSAKSNKSFHQDLSRRKRNLGKSEKVESDHVKQQNNRLSKALVEYIPVLG